MDSKISAYKNVKKGPLEKKKGKASSGKGSENTWTKGKGGGKRHRKNVKDIFLTKKIFVLICYLGTEIYERLPIWRRINNILDFVRSSVPERARSNEFENKEL